MFRAVALGFLNAKPSWTGNSIRKGELWEKKRSRAARLGGEAGVHHAGQTGMRSAMASSGSKRAVRRKPGIRLGGETGRLRHKPDIRPGEKVGGKVRGLRSAP